MNNFKLVVILEPGGRRGPGLCEDIPVPFLQVSAVVEGGSGGIPNLLPKEEKEEEKKEGDKEEKEMQGKRRDEEEKQESLVVEVGIIVPLPLASFPCSSCFKLIFSKKKLTNHTVEMNKDLTSCINWCLLRHQITQILS